MHVFGWIIRYADLALCFSCFFSPHHRVTPCSGRRGMTIFDFQQVCYDSCATTSTTYTATLHAFVTYSHAGYAKHGYATWLCHIWLRRLCQNLVTPHGYATYSHVGYAIHVRATWTWITMYSLFRSTIICTTILPADRMTDRKVLGYT